MAGRNLLETFKMGSWQKQMFLELKNTTLQSITSKILHFVTPLFLNMLYSGRYKDLLIILLTISKSVGILYGPAYTLRWAVLLFNIGELSSDDNQDTFRLIFTRIQVLHIYYARLFAYHFKNDKCYDSMRNASLILSKRWSFSLIIAG